MTKRFVRAKYVYNWTVTYRNEGLMERELIKKPHEKAAVDLSPGSPTVLLRRILIG